MVLIAHPRRVADCIDRTTVLYLMVGLPKDFKYDLGVFAAPMRRTTATRRVRQGAFEVMISMRPRFSLVKLTILQVLRSSDLVAPVSSIVREL